jgi:hypothetical protein
MTAAVPDDPQLLKLIEEMGLEDTSEPSPKSEKTTKATNTPKNIIEMPQTLPVAPGKPGNAMEAQTLSVHGSAPKDDVVPDDLPESSVDEVNISGMYNDAVQKLMNNHDSDRQELTDFIDGLKTKINDSEVPIRIYYETLANLIRTKTETSATLIKLLENLGRRLEKEPASSDALSDLL